MTSSDDALAHFGLEPAPHYDVPPLVIDDEAVRVRLRELYIERKNPHEPSEGEVRVWKIGMQAQHFLARPDDSRSEYLLRLCVTLEEAMMALDQWFPQPLPRPWHLVKAADLTELVNRILTAEGTRKA